MRRKKNQRHAVDVPSDPHCGGGGHAGGRRHNDGGSQGPELGPKEGQELLGAAVELELVGCFGYFLLISTFSYFPRFL